MFAKRMFTLLTSIHFLLVYIVKDAALYEYECKRVKVANCMDFHYNYTIFPNSLEHRRQEDAEIELQRYELLIQSGCSKHLRFFLCVLLVPVCTILKTPIPPCRSLCHRARNGCEDLLKSYGFSWPEHFKCDKFPEVSDQAICITPAEKSSKPEKAKRQDIFIDGRQGERLTLQCRDMAESLTIRKVRHSDGSRCRGKISKLALTKRCNGKRKCAFQLNGRTLGNQCHGRIGRTKVKYLCTKGSAKYGSTLFGQRLRLSCKGRKEIHVVAARFGVQSSCETLDAHCIASQQCNGKQSCQLHATAKNFQSKCIGRSTRLQVHYKCIRRPADPVRVIQRNASDIVQLSCPDDKRLSVIHAEYSQRAYCKIRGVLCIVFASCNGKNSCIVPSLNSSPNSCSSSNPSLTIRYQCVRDLPITW